MTAHAQHRGPEKVWPWTRDRNRITWLGPADSADVSGTPAERQEGPAASSTPPGRSWPVDASPADVAAARRWLAEYPDRVPASLPPPPYPHPAILPLLELVIAGHNAAAVLDAALRHQEAVSE